MATPTRITDRSHAQLRGDLMLAALAWGTAVTGSTLGVNPLQTTLAVLAWPMASFLVTGHLAGRGATMACLASGLGASIAPGASPASVAGLLAMVNGAAILGGRVAERLGSAVECVPGLDSGGRWMTVAVIREASVVVDPPRREFERRTPQAPRGYRPLAFDRTG